MVALIFICKEVKIFVFSLPTYLLVFCRNLFLKLLYASPGASSCDTYRTLPCDGITCWPVIPKSICRSTTSISVKSTAAMLAPRTRRSFNFKPPPNIFAKYWYTRLLLRAGVTPRAMSSTGLLSFDMAVVVGSGGGGEYFSLVRWLPALLKYSDMSRVMTSDSRRGS